MRNIFDGHALPGVLLEVALDVVLFKVDVPRKTVMNHDPLMRLEKKYVATRL